MARPNENQIVFEVVRRLTRCKYFDAEQIDTVAGFHKLPVKDHNRVVKKVVRTLERLGYRQHIEPKRRPLKGGKRSL